MTPDLMAARTLNVHGIELRENDDGDGRTISGLAVPFATTYEMFDGYGEQIDPTCDFGTRDTVKISREHGELIGRVTGMRRGADGLHITAKLADTASAREAANLIREGVYDSLSIGFKPVQNTVVTDESGYTIVHRTAIDLYEVAVTGIPAYQTAKITEQRTTGKEHPMNTDNNDTMQRIDDVETQLRNLKSSIADMTAPTTPAPLGAQYRNGVEYLRALAKGENEAVDLMRECRDMITTSDTGNTVTWIRDDFRLLEQRRKVMNILSHEALPDTGMTMEYNVVTSDTSATGRQANEGDALTFGKVGFGTKTAAISTYGGWTQLSRQVIERSTTPMLSIALRAMQNAYAKNTEQAVRDHLYSLIAAQRDATSDANKIDAPATAAAMTPDQWAALILNAAEVMDERNAQMTRLAVSQDVAMNIIALKDTGDRFLDISGKGANTLGSFDLTGIVGELLRVPVYVLPGATANTAAFIDPQAVTVWESGGPTQLSDSNITNLTDAYSVYGYMAIGDTFTDGLLPIKFAAK